MRTIDVCLSPDLMHLYAIEDRTVVIVDILRATSCMTAALAHGVSSITPFASLDECLSSKTSGCYTAGERNGEKVEGCDLGNSPFEYMDEKLRGKKISFTTTNGTQAISKSKNAREIVIGSFLNLSALVQYLKKGQNNILVVCAGWKGRVNLEDTVFAGAVVEHLKDIVTPECDAPVMAQHLYNQAKNDLMDFLKDCSHIKRLKRLNIIKDIEFCLTPDQYKVVPALKNGELVALGEQNQYV